MSLLRQWAFLLYLLTTYKMYSKTKLVVEIECGSEFQEEVAMAMIDSFKMAFNSDGLSHLLHKGNKVSVERIIDGKKEQTKVIDIEKKYGVNLNAPGHMYLEDYLKKEGMPNLAKLLTGTRKK